MNEIDKITLKNQAPVFISQLLLCGAMVGVFALLGRFSMLVLLGAILGAAASLGNYAVMIFSLLRAEKSDSPERAQLQVRGNYILRMIVLIAILAAAIKFASLDPLATLLPLILMRIALFIGGMMIRKGETV